MSWIAITIDTLYEAKVAALVDAANTAALADGQPNRVPGIIQGVVDDIRRKVASNVRNMVDNDETKVPKSLRDLAVDLIIARLKNSIEQALTEDEVRTIAKRNDDLNRIADGKDVVDQPDVPVAPPTQSGSGVQVVRTAERCHPYGRLL